MRKLVTNPATKLVVVGQVKVDNLFRVVTSEVFILKLSVHLCQTSPHQGTVIVDADLTLAFTLSQRTFLIIARA